MGKCSASVQPFSSQDPRSKEGSPEHYCRTGNHLHRPASCAAASPALGWRCGCLARVSTHSLVLRDLISVQLTCTVVAVSRADLTLNVLDHQTAKRELPTRENQHHTSRQGSCCSKILACITQQQQGSLVHQTPVPLCWTAPQV